jgi:hypothetical protein
MMMIRGILVPIDWDSEGNPIRAAVFSDKEEEYLINNRRKVKQLVGLMKHKVEVMGVIRIEAGRKIITVRSCKKTSWSQTPFDGTDGVTEIHPPAPDIFHDCGGRDHGGSSGLRR